MAEYWVLHNFGSEGWRVQSKHDGLWSAVIGRESDVQNGGGEVVIVEAIDTLTAYTRAEAERAQALRH